MSKFLEMVEENNPQGGEQSDIILDLFNKDKVQSATTSKGNVVVVMKDGSKLGFKFLGVKPVKEEEEDSLSSAASAIVNFKDTPVPTSTAGKKIAGAKTKIANAADAFATSFANQVRKAASVM